MAEIEAKPWTQPLFLVYDVGVDKMVPLTQERLDDLLQVERSYFDLACTMQEMISRQRDGLELARRVRKHAEIDGYNALTKVMLKSTIGDGA